MIRAGVCLGLNPPTFIFASAACGDARPLRLKVLGALTASLLELLLGGVSIPLMGMVAAIMSGLPPAALMLIFDLRLVGR